MVRYADEVRRKTETARVTAAASLPSRDFLSSVYSAYENMSRKSASRKYCIPKVSEKPKR